MATKEELMAQGFDEETAEMLADASEGASGGGGGLPFSVLKFNYDQKDILIDEGVAKGELVYGWKVNNSTLTVEEKGKTLGNTAEFFVVGVYYQYNKYDPNTNALLIQTDLFSSPFDGPKMVDKKSGKTIKQLRDEGVERIKFNKIMLLMVKDKDSESGYTPFVHYMHGTSLYEWSTQLEEKGIDPKNEVLATNFSVKTKRVPTNNQPAWVFEIVKAVERTPEEIQKTIPVVSDAIKKFKTWHDAVNSGQNTATANASAGGATSPASSVEVDIDEDDIPFD